MKLLLTVASVLILATTSVNGSIGRGACPMLQPLDYNAAWANSDVYYLHYVDKIIYNVYSLAQLVISSSLTTLDCQGMAAGQMLDANTYEAYFLNSTTSGKVPAQIAITYYDASSRSMILQACADANSLAKFLAGFTAGENGIDPNL